MSGLQGQGGRITLMVPAGVYLIVDDAGGPMVVATGPRQIGRGDDYARMGQGQVTPSLYAPASAADLEDPTRGSVLKSHVRASKRRLLGLRFGGIPDLEPTMPRYTRRCPAPPLWVGWHMT
ncbi:hypothetical protein CRD60_01135 [Bifidobacterium aemilianum]|uniref:Uncharacterized protein n=1 Tax=Bifidobacterium aemilianum TaxID=2493120 RepID=A0A366KA75_9BIFI|nr:hypothetical protein CRD60_01135 [Bifidobacterium aemilianum]